MLCFFRRGAVVVAALAVSAIPALAAGGSTAAAGMEVELRDVTIARASGLRITAATLAVDAREYISAGSVRFAVQQPRPATGSAGAFTGSLQGTRWLLDDLILFSGGSRFTSPLAIYDTAAEALTTNSGLSVYDPRFSVQAQRGTIDVGRGTAHLEGRVHGTVRP